MTKGFFVFVFSHYLPHLSVGSLISTSIYYSVTVMAACLNDGTTAREYRGGSQGMCVLPIECVGYVSCVSC